MQALELKLLSGHEMAPPINGMQTARSVESVQRSEVTICSDVVQSILTTLGMRLQSGSLANSDDTLFTFVWIEAPDKREQLRWHPCARVFFVRNVSNP